MVTRFMGDNYFDLKKGLTFNYDMLLDYLFFHILVTHEDDGRKCDGKSSLNKPLV